MSADQYDRRSQDIGNIIGLEHLNVTVPDQGLAALFYVTGLGLTRDPFIDFGSVNMWINAGSQQFHLPKQKSQILRGTVGMNVPSLATLAGRLKKLESYYGDQLQDTRFSWQNHQQYIRITCPWGNRFHVSEQAITGANSLGISWIEVDVAPGTTAGISRFYQEIMEAPSLQEKGLCAVRIGRYQTLKFRETATNLPEYDGHHIAIYLGNFSRPYERLLERGLITIESNKHEYRFQDISHPDTGEVLATIEHEVRSMYHPMFARNLVNRDAEQSFLNYQPGADSHIGQNQSGSA